MNKKLYTKSSTARKSKGVSIAALIGCFFIACSIWLYAQAVNDDINTKTYNQLHIECVGGDIFHETTGYDVHSLAIQNANISISGTNRELVKYDAQNIRLIADAGTANNGVATVKAYYIDEDGTRTEIKNYEVTPAVVTVYVANQVEYVIKDVTTEKNEDEYTYKLDQTSLSGTITIIGPVQDVTMIGLVGLELDYKNVANTPGTHTVPVSAISFFDVEGAPLYGDSNKNENIKYDTTAIMISVTVESKNAQTDDK